VLANFVCDAVALSPDRLLDMANAELTSHVQTLVNFSLTNPGVQIAIVPPLARTTPEWFNPYLPCFTTFLFGEISKAGRSQVRYLSPFVSPPHFFISDGVHLNQDAGIQFIRFILDGVDQIFPPVSSASHTQPLPTSFVHDSQPVIQDSIAAIPSTSTGASVPHLPSTFAVEFSRISSALGALTGLTGSLRDEARTRREQDNLIFARLKEDRDFEFNKNREDRFTLTGFSTPHAPREESEGEEGRKEGRKEGILSPEAARTRRQSMSRRSAPPRGQGCVCEPQVLFRISSHCFYDSNLSFHFYVISSVILLFIMFCSHFS